PREWQPGKGLGQPARDDGNRPLARITQRSHRPWDRPCACAIPGPMTSETSSEMSPLLKAFIEAMGLAVVFGGAAFWYKGAQDKVNRQAALLTGIGTLIVWFAVVVGS